MVTVEITPLVGGQCSAFVEFGKSKAFRSGFKSRQEAEQWVAAISPKVQLTFDEQTIQHRQWDQSGTI